ncbi:MULTISPECIES: carbohydrate ABC transporter permease [unclassified Paenibacillus]|uniref:carbohydrate ABC transporter permease n=1 Tax=unclassified Paenibacillus TaxID=185978 RepID=UPI0004F61923|nr:MULTISPECIES: carbohydrate ABC transporter permease [unclassified Paenibacillus]AIQ30087.1 sugar ABC transporter ATP-binding protein [Paenibacillus sp. FSL P4-0081]OMF31281.1 sugar ABC transporter ATP-binding protein [Paenibacillus sp. FSL H8-0259]
MRTKAWMEKGFVYLVLSAGGLFSLLPLIWLIRSSLMDMGQIFELPPIWIPNPFRFSNFSEALTILPFGRYFINTTIIVIFSMLGVLVTCSISAYSFARMSWRGRDLIFGLLLSSMMLPYAVTLIPTFIGWSKLGLTNSFIPLIAPAWFGGGAFNIFLLRQFYLSIPRDLDEAAYVDGASHGRIFISIIIPLTRPALVVVGLFTFLASWNDFLGPLVYLNDESKYTLALGLQQFKGMYAAEWHLMMAAATVVLAPAIIVFFIGQRYFIEGITLTGIKA